MVVMNITRDFFDVIKYFICIGGLRNGYQQTIATSHHINSDSLYFLEGLQIEEILV